jgi:FtsP/CotA-like multicopper oxidase with cupredoxin domain
MAPGGLSRKKLGVYLTASALVAAFAIFSALRFKGEQQRQTPPELRARNHSLSLTLHAVVGPDGRNSFSFNGQTKPPVLRVFPGDQLNITYINDLPAKPRESCAISPCLDMTNLHFHGLQVSPNAPQDDVLDMMAMPGETLNYSVQIPRDHPPGLYWYHTHPHGESQRQVLDGMSGAIVIESIDRYVPEVRDLREQIIVVRGREIKHDAEAADLKQRVELSSKGCGGEAEKAERIFTVNGEVRPDIEMSPGERQFWRIVNASADSYLDLELMGQSFEVVAMDGMPIAYHNPGHPMRVADHVLLPPAGRVEAIVTGPAPGTRGFLSTRCVDTGPDGDPNPAMVLADLVPGSGFSSTEKKTASAGPPPAYKAIDVTAEEKAPPRFVVTFTEDKSGFYINEKKFAADAAPMARVKIGSYQHWRIVNATNELHPMHIHQTHFLAYAENGRALPDPVWLDTVNVPHGGSVDVIMDFTDPVIKGMSVFHCHLLNHEDKGMMAKILFE